MESERRRPYVVGIGGSLRPGSISGRALGMALAGAEAAGASIELLELDECALPLYRPGPSLESFGPGAVRLIRASREADALIWSTSAYHGSLAGATKNALDYLEFLADDDEPYLSGKPVGLISTASGEIAAVNAVNSMIHVAHALRAVVAPLYVPISHASHAFAGPAGPDGRWVSRLDKLGRLVVEMVVGTSAARRFELEARASLSTV